VYEPWYQVFSDQRIPVKIRHDAPLIDSGGEKAGRGWNMTAVLRDGEDVIGVLCADNLLQGAPLQQSQIELLGLYGSVVGHLYVRKRAEQRLTDSLQRLHTLASHLQSVREEERTRIAREVHDELGQTLTGLKMSLAELKRSVERNPQAVSAEMLLEKILSMNTLIESTLSTVRRIATELRPAVLDTLGLVSALEWQAQDFARKTGISCQFSSRLEEVMLDGERKTAVFRIFQESLTNVWRHAGASRVRARLERRSGMLVLMVEDNGRGIREEDLSGSKSFGLLSMRERALLLGGEVEIVGKPKKGTRVTLKLPILPAS
jgi:signal transduction histidine kinase